MELKEVQPRRAIPGEWRAIRPKPASTKPPIPVNLDRVFWTRAGHLSNPPNGKTTLTEERKLPIRLRLVIPVTLMVVLYHSAAGRFGDRLTRFFRGLLAQRQHAKISSCSSNEAIAKDAITGPQNGDSCLFVSKCAICHGTDGLPKQPFE